MLLENSANAAQFHSLSTSHTKPVQIQSQFNCPSNTSHILSISNHKTSSSASNPQTPPTHSRVTFQSTPNSNTNRSSNDGQTSPNLELSKEEVFENNLTQLFTKGFIQIHTLFIQIDFGGPIANEKDQDIYFLACIDRFSKYPSVEVVDKANGPNIIKFLDDYIQIHGVPRNIRLDQARCLIGYKVKNFCKQHNINVITAPANDHRAIGLVERLIQTIKRRLGCMKLDTRNNTFTIKEAIKSIVYQLRICKQKTTKVTPFQAHFGRKPNTPLSNISTTPKSSNLSYENILHHYLDADIVPVEDYLDENGWVTGDRSDILIDEAMQRAQVDAGRCYNGDHNKSVSRFILHPKLNNPIPRTEQSLDLKLARKVTKRSKRDLCGLWETLAPGSTVVRTSNTTTVIKEPGVPEVSVRNSDIAKFGTRAERNTDLWEYAKRRPLPYEKTTEEKIAQHTKELKKKFRGEIKIRHRHNQSDAASGVSSANSNISKAMASIKNTKNTNRRQTIPNCIHDTEHL